ELDIKVSVLTPPIPLEVSRADDLLAVLRPGVDGLVLADSSRRATFLPTVWRRFRDPRSFLAALLAKGGWAEHEWPDNLAIHRYQAYEFCDPAPRDPLPSSDRPERTSPCIRSSQRR
ncbi:MAG TPA: AMMECR1 domain-containing protein, partial [Micromonosporaceae bacterium]|nr:AMMECR1 domain-containing protein [Micromonosporaceae bacterium]